MSVKLRGHHLLCILTFVGHGYSRAFSDNYKAVVRRLNAGEPVVLVDGPDDICAALIKEEAEPHCFKCSVTKRDAAALEIVGAVLERPLGIGEELVLSADMIALLRDAYGNGKMEAACNGCEWQPFCDDIAKSGFKKGLLG
ncbi:(2Fe-2S) ferredoxin [Pseudovibrio japonicus]|uniref:(2Fe-2S) ferredoxin n=1 Tax=Pseudovibrio japonicus TaxID=366534 RepID=A0ABQ3E997_9HYPH|nr:DUF1284 domain-containing protein [Pseudovibrio japonicus]GHB30222.1 (2Fe-2S) ferredoxin [Pseudovibrio japonicus]